MSGGIFMPYNGYSYALGEARTLRIGGVISWF